jgi:nucleotide-binding universal stress UspA family protein
MTRADVHPVLVATDLGLGGDEAVRQADAWAQRAGRPLVVVHALPDPLRIAPLFPQDGIVASDVMGQLRDLAIDALERRIYDLTGRAPNEVALMLEPGSPHAAILEATDRLHPDLVVVGGSGKSRVSELLLGSTAEQVVRHARGPVLVARPSPRSKTLMAATDLSENGLPALDAAVEVGQRRNALVLGLHCLDVAHPALAAFEPTLIVDRGTMQRLHEGAEQVLGAALERAKAEMSEVIVVEGSPMRAIVAVAREREVELIVVATHGRTGLKRLTMGSVAAAVVRAAPCSVLVVRSHASSPGR